MRPALDRLLSRPSSLRLLRSLVTTPDLSLLATSIHCERRRAFSEENRSAKRFISPRKQLEREIQQFIQEPEEAVATGEKQDNWIAKLLATEWIPLEVSLNTILAAGVANLQPLSLQALARRYETTAAIRSALQRLEQNGLDCQKSAYGRALFSFSTKNNYKFLNALLASDQHPAEYDNVELQRELINAARTAGDLKRHKFLRQVQEEYSVDPKIRRYNRKLLDAAISHDNAAIITTLDEMRMSRIPVQSKTIFSIKRHVLRPRTSGNRPVHNVSEFESHDIDFLIFILRKIHSGGGFVSVRAWREVVKRLGMVGRLKDLFRILAYLVKIYMPTVKSRPGKEGEGKVADNGMFAHDLPLSHELHPLRILFNDTLQRSLVEWSIMYSLAEYAISVGAGHTLTGGKETHALKESMTRGISFLLAMRKKGIYIKDENIRNAVYQRLVIMYGTGYSERAFNRAIVPYTPFDLQVMVDLVHQKSGMVLFPSFYELKCDIRAKWEKVQKGRKPIKGHRLYEAAITRPYDLQTGDWDEVRPSVEAFQDQNAPRTPHAIIKDAYKSYGDENAYKGSGDEDEIEFV